MEKFDYDDEQVSALIIGLYVGAITIKNIPLQLYKQTAKVLKSGLYKGYGGTLNDFEFGKPDYDLLKELRYNIYIFSGAKCATQMADIKSLMVKDGEIVPMNEFKKLALDRFEVYNGKDGYLESEYITAMTSGSSAINWNYTEEHKDIFPRLRSVAIIDSNTAPECERMNGVIANVDDPIWSHNIAPRHFRCRCHEERIDKYDEVKSTPNHEVRSIEKKNDETMSPLFKMNPGKDGYVFSKEHPYFDIGRKYPNTGKINFGLPIPEKD